MSATEQVNMTLATTTVGGDQADASAPERRPKRRGRRCKFCGEPRAATLRCDHPRPWRRPGACDAHMCPRCASSVSGTDGGESVNFCPKHASQFAEFSPSSQFHDHYRASVIEKARQLRAARAELGHTRARRLAHVEATLAQVERVCAAHGFDAGAGRSAAEWIEARLGKLDELAAVLSLAASVLAGKEGAADINGHARRSSQRRSELT